MDRRGGRAFVSRREHSGYLRWVYERTVVALPPGIAVHHHPCRALRVAGARTERQTVRLKGLDAPLAADAVILAQGHLDARTRRGTSRVGGLRRTPRSGVFATRVHRRQRPDTRDPLLRALYAGGAAATPAGLLAVDPVDGRVLDRSGVPYPRRFALGPQTDARGAGGFTRPGANALTSRQNDATARTVLALLCDLRRTRGFPEPYGKVKHHEHG